MKKVLILLKNNLILNLFRHRKDKQQRDFGMNLWRCAGFMKYMTLIFIMYIFTLNNVYAAIRISPNYIELDANKSKKDYLSGSFTVTGGKDETIRFKIYPSFFEHDSNGYFVELDDKEQKNSLMGKVKFYPSEFTCENGQEQKVRVTVTGIKSLPGGESRLTLFLEDKNTKEVVIKNVGNGCGGRIFIKTRVGVPIYVDKGIYNRKGSLEKVALKTIDDGYTCEYKVSSAGNSKIRYNGLIYISQGDKLVKKLDLVGSTIEGGHYVNKVVKLDLAKDELAQGQEYKVKFVIFYMDEKNHEKTLKKEFTFTPENISEKKT